MRLKTIKIRRGRAEYSGTITFAEKHVEDLVEGAVERMVNNEQAERREYLGPFTIQVQRER